MTIATSRWKSRYICAFLASTLLLVAANRAQQAASVASKQLMQDASKMPYMNPALPIDQRVDYLLHHMTIEEKAMQLVNQARSVPHLGLPAYDWWSESLHGVAVNGTTAAQISPKRVASRRLKPGFRRT